MRPFVPCWLRTLSRPKAGAALLLPLLLASCHDIARVDTKGIKREMEERTVYRITDDQLLQGAQTVGDRLATQLDSAIAAGLAADADWQTSIAPVLEQQAAPLRIEVRVLPFDSIPAFKATEKERQVLDALLYSHRQGQPASPNIQKLDDRSFQYIRPVELPDAGMIAGAPGNGIKTAAIYHIRIPSRPAALEASKGMKGMN